MLFYTVLCCDDKRSKMYFNKKIPLYVIGHTKEVISTVTQILQRVTKNNRKNSSQGPSGFWKIKMSYKK